MDTRPRIAVACRTRTDRAAIEEWLTSGGYEPVPISALGTVPDFDALDVEMLVIDARFAGSDALQQSARAGASPRPVVVIGHADAAAQTDAARRAVRYLARPIDRMALLMAVTLAFSIGQPARRARQVPAARLRNADIDIDLAFGRA